MLRNLMKRNENCLTVNETWSKHRSMVTASCQAGTQPTVLVIDDEAGPRDALKVILRTFCTVRSAENAKTALEVLESGTH